MKENNLGIMSLMTIIILCGILIIIGTTPGAEAKITFDLQSSTWKSYSNALASLRSELKDRTLKPCGVPTLPQYPEAQAPTYILVDVKATADKTITLAINKKNVYIVGYRDKIDGKHRAHFFPDAPVNAKNELFPEAKGKDFRLTINYGSNYDTIENKAETKRYQMPLGPAKLAFYIEGVYGKKKIVVKDEARLVLAFAQMVAEAARFSYIETKIRENFNVQNGFVPDLKFVDLQNNWDPISKVIHSSSKDTNKKTKCKVSATAVRLWDLDEGRLKDVTDVTKLIADVALLNSEKKKKITAYSFEDGDDPTILSSS